MIYLLDANVLITANNFYYPVDRVPEYWDWIFHLASKGTIKIPNEQFEEIKEGPDDEEKDKLFAWIQQKEISDAILFNEEVNPALVQRVVFDGYASDLTDDELEQLGRDPFLIAHALGTPGSCVVTVEVSKPSKIRQNRKIPDVCNRLGVIWSDPFKMYRELNFSTSWKKSG